MNNYGLILKQLRQLNGFTLKTAAEKVGKSVGWLSEVENNRGLSKLAQSDFERIVKLFGGDKHRELFKTWVAIERTKEKADRSLDGPVLKHVRERKGFSLDEAGPRIGISKRYLSNLENGHRPIKLEMRNRIMKAYGYSPTSFRNLTADEKRARVVPVKYKINALLNQVEESDLYIIFEFINKLSIRPHRAPLAFLDESNSKDSTHHQEQLV